MIVKYLRQRYAPLLHAVVDFATVVLPSLRGVLCRSPSIRCFAAEDVKLMAAAVAEAGVACCRRVQTSAAMIALMTVLALVRVIDYIYVDLDGSVGSDPIVIMIVPVLVLTASAPTVVALPSSNGDGGGGGGGCSGRCRIGNAAGGTDDDEEVHSSVHSNLHWAARLV